MCSFRQIQNQFVLFGTSEISLNSKITSELQILASNVLSKIIGSKHYKFQNRHLLILFQRLITSTQTNQFFKKIRNSIWIFVTCPNTGYINKFTFNILLLVQKNVLRFKIPKHIPFLVNILNRVHRLRENPFDQLLRHLPIARHVFKQIAPVHVLQHHVDPTLLLEEI